MENKRKIVIDNELCSQCGKCAKLCPEKVLLQSKKKGNISICNVENCSLCGKCIEKCRRRAILIDGSCTKKTNSLEDIVRFKGFVCSLFLFPIMLLVGFLMHPHLLQMKMMFTAQDLVERFHNNSYYHIGHFIVMFAVPFIIIAMVGVMNILQSTGKRWGFWGCIIGIFGAFILAVDKGALCLVLSAFDTLPEQDFVNFAPTLQVIVDKAGLLWVCNLLSLLTVGAIIQFVGLIKEHKIKLWKGIISILGLLLLNNPDIELISSIGTIFMSIGYMSLGVNEIRKHTGNHIA